MVGVAFLSRKTREDDIELRARFPVVLVGLLGRAYSNKWNIMVALVSVPTMEKRKRFCLRYALKVTMYMLRWERNKRRHGDLPRPMQVLAKFIDKSIRNKLSLVQMKEMKGMVDSLQYWFGTRL
ncbi:hypothetical protein DY000_02046639 [Brassica cretica]|uniref:Uncharacterized protein n=1 Tax=Brassica cretica TaxID=69181 RepID=A0ABQ7F976_BRACR|nr:hypothetical protein DY000_02046639 [Brassica cretica]